MSDLVGNPEDRFSRVAAHLILVIKPSQSNIRIILMQIAVPRVSPAFYSFNPSMYYSIAITVMEKVPREKKKSGFKRLFIRQYDYFRM